MYKVSSHVIRNTALLMRRINPAELRIVSFSQSPVSQAWYKRTKERDTCPPKPPPPLPPLNIPYFLINTGLALALTAGFMVYAKHYPEVRDWLSINAPWFDNLIAVVYEENKPITEGISDYVVYFKKGIEKYFEEPPEECLTGVKPPAPIPVSKNVPVATANVCDNDEDDDEDEKEDEEDEELCIIPPPPILTGDICQLEACLKEAAEDVIHNYMTARDYCFYYCQLVKGTMMTFSVKGMKFLQSQMDEKAEIVEKHVGMAKDALKRFNNLSEYINCGAQAPKDRLDVSKQMSLDFMDNIKRIEIEFVQQHQLSQACDRQWKMVECLVDVYVSETTSLHPELNYYDEEPKIKSDYDYILIHTMKYDQILKQEMQDKAQVISSRINRAYEALTKCKEKETEEKMEAAIKKAVADMQKEFSDRETQMNTDNENELNRKLTEQKKIYDDTFAARFAERERAANEAAEKMIKEQVEAEKKILQAELDQMNAQLIAVEAQLEERLKAERETKRAQQLHSASTALLQATKKCAPRVKVDKELEILRKASTEDDLVSAVLNAIPGDVKEKGVVPECFVRDKFRTMEDIAMKVALVEAPGGSLVVYAISWLQSKLLFMKPRSISHEELQNPPQEPFKDLDTFDLLLRARYFMQNGNLSNALRYVDALEGASRGAAEAWFQNANALLQTRQAAEAILAHAAAINLQYI